MWLLLAPRDYLSTFVKLGTIAILALGIVLVRPTLQMPALTRFIDGSGPVFAGNLFPFAFITIACGAISGFHSLISSGTTPKMIAREPQTRMVGYGAMMAESFVGIMAMIAACTLQPGTYLAVNSGAGMVGGNAGGGRRHHQQLGLSRHQPIRWPRWRTTSARRRSSSAPAVRRPLPWAWPRFFLTAWVAPR